MAEGLGSGDGAVTGAGQSLPSPRSGKSSLGTFLCCL